ncbi:MAG: serine/threonine-protein kinase [Myxococcaceae bacterium]|nr:serine/threonine-protein kinase [Myxococcaceae bacterium]
MTTPLPLTAASALPDVGTLLGGKYQLLRFVAAGGMGAVFEAQHVKLGRRVAVKLLLPQRKNEGQLAARFLREARSLARLKNRHVAQVLDVDETPDGLPYMVLEYLEGSDLAQQLGPASAMPVEERLAHIRSVCEALEEAHAQGIIHRDIKPSNLFLASTPEGPCLKLFDFGIAHTEDEHDARLTQGVTLGTPDFMSPEQLTGASLSPASDVWSLAVTTYQWLTDALPFEGRDTRAKTTAILTSPPIPLSQRGGTFPPGVWPVLEAALEKEPARRTPSARAFSDALGRVLAGQTDVVSRPQTPAPRPERASRLPLALGALALCLAAVLVVATRSVESTPAATAAPPAPAPTPAAQAPAAPPPTPAALEPVPEAPTVETHAPPPEDTAPPSPAPAPATRKASKRPVPAPPPTPDHPKYL